MAADTDIKRRMLQLSAEHPEYTAAQIAEALGCATAYVYRVNKRCDIGINLPGRGRGPAQVATLSLVKDSIAFAIEHGDNCLIPDGYADAHGFSDSDWLSDWGAFLADRVIEEFKARGLQVTRRHALPSQDGEAKS